MFSSADKDAPRVFRQLGLTHHLALLDQAWQAELGSLARLAPIVAIDQGSLVVETVSPPAMQEIHLRRKELLRRVNRHFPEPMIKHITVRMSHGN